MALTSYQRLAYRIFGARLEGRREANAYLRSSLEEAQMPFRPEVYLSFCYLNMVLVSLVGLLPLVILAGLTVGQVISFPAILFVFLVPLPAVLAAIVYLISYTLPDLRAHGRARDIETKLPYALNYVATMAQAGMTPPRIFRGLAEQDLYGEVSREAELIARDIEFMGKDAVTALKDAADRTPSIKFQDLLHGAVASLTSGGDFKEYLLTKSEQFMFENRQDQKRFLDSLGVLAESFVTVVVAAPLFLLVLFTVTTAFGSGAQSSLAMGYLVILVMLPLAQLGFAMTIKASTPEA